MAMHLFTSESVTEGHPDKLADQISDAILDECLAQDANARCAMETLLSRGVAVVAGELTTSAYVEIPDVVRRTINDVGYTSTSLGFEGDTCGVMVAIQQQSPDIAMGVDIGGAGDQGMMIGLACDETPELMPLPISIAHALTRRLTEARKKREDDELFRPDGKSQVTVAYEDGRPKYIDTIVVSTQHKPVEDQEQVRQVVRKHVIEPVLQNYQSYVDRDITYHINPTGQFIIGGPQADTGVTGRKVVVDTYGGACPVGGGAFSGKDPTKVDRSASYMARHIAKCIVAAGLAQRVELHLAYAIGVAQPVAINVLTFGTGKVSDDTIAQRVRGTFDLSPRGIIEYLDLLSNKYLPTAKNGHFGNPAFPWESTEAASRLA
ncbi:MAG: methionine adenosyltransferase [Fimbriimonadia bacterium]|jgi:S-adenosylmethionine synthetase